jgi:hypothetical protein
MYVIQHCYICCPLDSTVSEDAGIEPMQDCCNFGIDSQMPLTTPVDLIHNSAYSILYISRYRTYITYIYLLYAVLGAEREGCVCLVKSISNFRLVAAQ